MARTVNWTSKISAFFKIDLNLEGVTRVRWLSIRCYNRHWIDKSSCFDFVFSDKGKLFFICKVNVVGDLKLKTEPEVCEQIITLNKSVF